MKVSLYATPIPGQNIKGDDLFLGTVRTHMHKAPYTALISGLEPRLADRGVNANVRIVDMQTMNPQQEKYGELDYQGLILEKFRVGCSFDTVQDSIKEDDIVGVNANFTHSRLTATDFAKYAKQTNPNALVVFGGTDATQDPAYYLHNGADIVVKGEAEVTFELLIDAIHKCTGFADIPNISYWDGGRMVHNTSIFKQKESAFDVETMNPPALDAVDFKSYMDSGEGDPYVGGIEGPFISVETSRGCAQACTFCATPFTKGRFRFMYIDTIRTHFEYLRDLGIRTILFQEDAVLSRIHRKPNGTYQYPEGRDELIAMFKLAREMGFAWEFPNGVEFGQLIHNDEVDYELIDLMFWHEYGADRSMGCYRAAIPLENLTDEGSKLFRKLKPLGQMKRVIEALTQKGVDSLTFNVIVGRPQDDERNLVLTYGRCMEVKELIYSINPNINVYYNVFNLSVFPGTIDYKKFLPLLAFDIEKDPEVITFYLACLNTDHFTPLEMAQARGSLSMALNDDQMISDVDNNRMITHPRFDALFR